MDDLNTRIRTARDSDQMELFPFEKEKSTWITVTLGSILVAVILILGYFLFV